MKEVMFNKPSTQEFPLFLGRNGTFNCAGVAITGTPGTSEGRYAPLVTLRPITSKGTIGRAMIEIPLSDLEAVIAAARREAQGIKQ